MYAVNLLALAGSNENVCVLLPVMISGVPLLVLPPADNCNVFPLAHTADPVTAANRI